ncbi:MAG: thioredoxin-dependent thiol peroxidase [Mycoplasmatales bacterium]
MLKEQTKAPDFTLEATTGDMITLKDFRGQKVVLYFYPKNNTPGCTLEAQEFKANLEQFRAKNVVVLGVTIDTLKKSMNFSCKHELNFPILTDVDGKVCNEYGVWQLKKNYGKEYYGIVRSTFIINEDGVIEKQFTNVRVKNHVETILEHL